MSKLLKFTRLASLSLLLAPPLLAQDAPSIDAVVATVNRQEITLGEMIALRDALPQQYQELPDDVLYTGILDQVVQQTILAQALEGGAPRRVEIALGNERRALLAAVVLQGVLDREISEADIQAAYDAQYAEFEGDIEYNASHILLETEEEARVTREELVAGADFAEMAKAKSTGPSGPSGGLLGWFGTGRMVKPFEDAVANMAIGDISQPVQTQFGWHLIILNDTRRTAAPTLDEVREELVADLQGKAVDAFIADLTVKSDIDKTGAEKFDPSVITRSDLLDAE